MKKSHAIKNDVRREKPYVGNPHAWFDEGEVAMEEQRPHLCRRLSFVGAVCALLVTALVADAGQGLETERIQREIDRVSADGGGRVVIAKGVHPCGTLYLKSNVELHLEDVAELRGGGMPADYDDAIPVDEVYSYEGAVPATVTRKAFVYAENVTNIAITGKGMINGCGQQFFDQKTWAKPTHLHRPRMVVFRKCRGIRLEDATFKDSPLWTMWLRRCEGIVISRIRIDADQRMINTDGIDFDACRNVRVGDSSFSTGDDCFAIRAIRHACDMEEAITEDLVVSNCVLSTTCQGVRIACPSDRVIRNAVFRDITFTGNNAIFADQQRWYLEKDDTGSIVTHGILFENWKIDCSGSAISAVVTDGVTLRDFGHMTFRNIEFKADKPIRICGNTTTVVRNMVLENVRGKVKADMPFVFTRTENLRTADFHVNERDQTNQVGSKGHGAERVQRPFEVSPRHKPRLVMGREYWTYLNYTPLTDPVTWNELDPSVWTRPWYNPALTNYAAFSECGIVSSAWAPPPDPKGSKASLRTVREHFTPNDWAGIERNATRNRPLVIDFRAKRTSEALTGEVDVDTEDWRLFKKTHPNLVCTRTSNEWGWTLLCIAQRNKGKRDGKLSEARGNEMMSYFANCDLSDRFDRVRLQKWYFDRLKKLNCDDADTFLGFRHILYIDHLAAAWGAKCLVSETTNTTGEHDEYRWDVSGMFVRGAARQFSIPWCWYVAVFFNGRKENGEMMYNSFPSYTKGKPFPEGGVSASLQRRAWFYAYLNGANAVEPEGWHEHFFTTNTPSGKAELSDRGRHFVDFHDFTKRHADRGVTYAPVAVLTPFAQGLTATGGKSWMTCPLTEGDYALNALFFTIAPGWNRRQGLFEGREEGCLHNSRFAMMYDVLVPDSPQPKEEFRKALFAYPAAILVGDYQKPELFEDVLKDYVKAGGELVRLSPDMLPPMGDNPILDMQKGVRPFPVIEQKLDSLQKRLFPFGVKGDVLFGANRTKKGWWLWTFNNKGVCKFADAFERIDHSADAQIEVSLGKVRARTVVELMSGREVRVRGGRFADLVPAGDFHVFEITE